MKYDWRTILVGGLEHLSFSIIYIYDNKWDNPSQLTFIFFKMVKATNLVQFLSGFIWQLVTR